MKKEELAEVVRNEKIRFIKLFFVGARGDIHVIDVPDHEFSKALDGKVMIDGSNIEGLCVPVHISDMSLCPDINSFRPVPFLDRESGKTAALFCDICTPDGKPAAGCTRSNLKKALGKMAEGAFSKMNVGFEPEFFLLKNKPVCALDKADLIDGGDYCSDAAGIDVLKEIVFELERMGIVCATCHHERSPSQYELTYRFSDAVSACDEVLLVRFIIKAVAAKRGFEVTFMPKPVSNFNGSGLHTNISLVSGGKNAFAGKNGLSGTAVSFIAGILAHARALCLVTNPTINSYKRLGKDGYEAPVNISWGKGNRSTMVRVPECSGESARIEVRSTDSTANPYAAITGFLAAGLDGIYKRMSAEPTDKNIYALGLDEKKKLGMKCLPDNLWEAITEFEADDILKESFSKEIFDSLIAAAKKEVCDYKHSVNSFDFERYF